MVGKNTPKDFVKFLQSQLKAFRARRFEQLDVEVLGDELEGVVGQYRREVHEHARGVIEILMRREYIYGDWSELTRKWGMLRDVLKESPSLTKTAAAKMKWAYRSARICAELRGEGWWHVRCPWRTLDELGRAVKARDREYRILEQQHHPDFVALRPIPIPERVRRRATRPRSAHAKSRAASGASRRRRARVR